MVKCNDIVMPPATHNISAFNVFGLVNILFIVLIPNRSAQNIFAHTSANIRICVRLADLRILSSCATFNLGSG